MEDDPNRLNPLVESLIGSAFAVIDRKYGTDGLSPKGYHNRFHTSDVLNSASYLSDLAIAKGRLDCNLKPLLLIAAAFHDIEQDLGPGNNELASSEKAYRAMKESGIFDEEDCRIVSGAILGTRIFFEEEIMKQSVSTESPYITQLLADADLMSLGSNEELYWERAIGLFNELHPGKSSLSPEWRLFLVKQVKLLSSHKYFTPEAEEMFIYQAENLASTERALALVA